MSKKIYLPLLGIVIIGAVFLFWQNRNKAENSSSIPANTQQGQTGKHLVEIFYLPHAPAQAVVKKVEPIIAQFPDFQVKEYDLLNSQNKAVMESHNLTEHLPVAIFIDGKADFSTGGKEVSLKNFPKSDSFVPSFAGNWDYDDLKSILTDNDK